MDEGRLVKTRQFKDPRYVGDPINAIRIFNEKEVDELVLLDIGVSRRHAEPHFALIEQIAGECFMPLCYGGGVSSVAQAKRLFSIGVEKVAVQTAVLDDFSLVRQIAELYGRQAVVVSIDVKTAVFGGRRLYSFARSRTLAKSWKAFLAEAVASGAGEVLLNNVDRDGKMKGLDLELVRDASSSLPVPLIVAGGVGSHDDIRAGLIAGASAVAVGSYFVFYGPHRAVLISYPSQRELATIAEGV